MSMLAEAYKNRYEQT
jgi:hypothetical protein